MALLIAIAGCNRHDDAAPVIAPVDLSSDWPANGRTALDQGYSPLDQINDGNAQSLGLAWSFDLPQSVSSSAAPLEIAGTLYVATGFSVVHALDAVSGKELWSYDPEVAAVAGDKLRAAWGIRGLAWWRGHVLIGTQDGRLLSIDAKSGRLGWSVQTTEPGDGRYITGAPTVFGDKVIIGHGGADLSPTRGYVTTYDAATGKQLWRFHTVPGNPADGFENDAMRMAAKTWTGEWWKFGGGGTVWNAITYDPQFKRIYLGTGNGFPWNQKIRSPGGGDNLFLSSIVALDADTGKYLWHYQTNPGETWDYNSAMDIVLADLKLGDKSVPVILHAPKNGFFYVIDRRTGKLLSAEKFATVTWADRIDLQTGRPVETDNARYTQGPFTLSPWGGGAHSWHKMAFNPGTGLVYIPVNDQSAVYSDAGIDPKAWQPLPRMTLNPGVAAMPMELQSTSNGSGLLAWNPVTGKPVWRISFPNGVNNSGVSTTAGNIVLQGRPDCQPARKVDPLSACNIDPS